MSVLDQSIDLSEIPLELIAGKNKSLSIASAPTLALFESFESGCHEILSCVLRIPRHFCSVAVALDAFFRSL